MGGLCNRHKDERNMKGSESFQKYSSMMTVLFTPYKGLSWAASIGHYQKLVFSAKINFQSQVKGLYWHFKDMLETVCSRLDIPFKNKWNLWFLFKFLVFCNKRMPTAIQLKTSPTSILSYWGSNFIIKNSHFRIQQSAENYRLTYKRLLKLTLLSSSNFWLFVSLNCRIWYILLALIRI